MSDASTSEAPKSDAADAAHSDHGDGGGADHGDPGIGIYLAVFAGLLILTGVTVGVAYVDFGTTALNTAIALAIATTKATLVAVWFMHLNVASRLHALSLVGAVFWLVVLIVITMADYVTRPAQPVAPVGYERPAVLVDTGPR